MQREEHILRQFLRLAPALEKVIRQPEHHRLMFADDGRKRALAASLCLDEQLVPGKGGNRKRGSRGQHPEPYTTGREEKVQNGRIAMRIDEIGGGAVVFLSCGCCALRGPVPTFGRIWVQIVKPCDSHSDRHDVPLLLSVDHHVSPFVRTLRREAFTDE
jgi:hypothetical protein